MRRPSHFPQHLDRLYADLSTTPRPFTFNEQVASVFDDMLHRSIPGYDAMVLGVQSICKQMLTQQAPIIYDLGCSLGNISMAIAQSIRSLSPRIYAVDSSQAMLKGCQARIQCSDLADLIVPVHADLRLLIFSPCNAVFSIFTLQFLPIKDRLSILRKVFAALKAGGWFVLAEKCTASENDVEAMCTAFHEAYKRQQGYSEREIWAKKEALKNVLISETAQQHEARLNEVGFINVIKWFQLFNFNGFFAQKPLNS